MGIKGDIYRSPSCGMKDTVDNIFPPNRRRRKTVPGKMQKRARGKRDMARLESVVPLWFLIG
jgi:hypothetical protein